MRKKQAIIGVGFALTAVAAVGVLLDSERIAPWQPDPDEADACYALRSQDWEALERLADETGSSSASFVANLMLQSRAPALAQPRENVLDATLKNFRYTWTDCVRLVGADEIGEVGGSAYSEVAAEIASHVQSLPGWQD